MIGIIPALEPSHALYQTIKIAKSLGKDKDVLVNLCGRGDKGKQILKVIVIIMTFMFSTILFFT